MKKCMMRVLLASLIAVITGCAGTPVILGSKIAGELPTGEERSIKAEACGFQLLLFIPIGVNDRLSRAYDLLEAKAGGDFITNVSLEESWTYGFVGTNYCSKLDATAIRRK